MKLYRIILILSIFFSSLAIAKDNVSLSKVLLRFQGEEYNMLLFPHHIVAQGKKRKTKKAIAKGYSRAISELTRQIAIRGIDLNIKAFSKRGSNLDQYEEEDTDTYFILKDMINMQVQIREDIFEDLINEEKEDDVNVDEKVSADDIEMDDMVIEISDDEATVDGEVMSPSDAFVSGFVELSEQYNNQVLKLSQVLHPFNINGKPVNKNIHSVFGISFFPDKIGRIKMMKMYIILANIDTETNQSVQIIAKDISSFQWDRNYLYISAATGKMIRQIVSGVIGEPFLFIK